MDGAFVYAVRSTGVFCRPSCKSKTPNRARVCFFHTAAQAQAAGFRPCKRCRPELSAYRPDLEIAEKAKAAIDGGFGDAAGLRLALGGLGLTRRRLDEIFRLRYGTGMTAYTARRRMERARALLELSALNVDQVAEAAGFGSLSAFYRAFRAHAGVPPARFRRMHAKAGMADDPHP